MDYTQKRKRKREEILVDDYEGRPSLWASIGVGTVFLWRNLVAKPVRWTWRQFVRVTGFTLRLSWLITAWTARTTWRATVWTVRQTWAVTKWTAQAPFRLVGWLYNTFIRGEPEPNDPFLAIRWRIKRRFRRRQRFMTHLFTFALMNGVMWIDWMNYFSIVNSGTSQRFLFTAMWSVILFFHFARMRLAEAEDHAMQTALERQHEYQTPYLVEDEYNPDMDDRYARLTNDEFIEAEIPRAKRKRS